MDAFFVIAVMDVDNDVGSKRVLEDAGTTNIVMFRDAPISDINIALMTNNRYLLILHIFSGPFETTENPTAYIFSFS